MEDEAELIERAKSGDQSAFESLVKLHQARVLARVRIRLPEDLRSEAEDMAQETFVKAWERLGSFERRHEGGFLAWLTTIALRLCLDRIRERKRDDVGKETLEWQVMQKGLQAALVWGNR